jgi:hypothetical protein
MKNQIMKKIFLVTFVGLLAISCGSKSNSEAILGKWVLSDMEYQIDGADEQSKAFADAMKKELIGKMSLELKADNTQISYVPIMGGKAVEGTWSISDDGKTLTTTENGEESEEMTIKSMDSNTLVLFKSDSKGPSSMTFKKE